MGHGGRKGLPKPLAVCILPNAASRIGLISRRLDQTRFSGDSVSLSLGDEEQH